MVLILDGGSTSVLDHLTDSQRSHVMNSPLWTSQALFSFPRAVAAMYKDYIYSGADLISCMTYQQSEMTMNHVENMPDAYDVGMRIAIESCETTRANAVLCLGTHAAMLGNGAEYAHTYERADVAMLKAFHGARLQDFAKMRSWQAVRYIAFETLPDVLEAEAILEVLHDLSKNSVDLRAKKIWISFSCSGEGAEEKVIKGQQRLLAHPQIGMLWGLGINCFKEDKASVVAPFCAALQGRDLYAVIYRDAGPQWDAIQRRFIGEAMPPRVWARRAAEDAERHGGRVVIGGCCQTTPEHIRELKSCIYTK